MSAHSAIALVSEPPDADRTRKTRWYARYAKLAASMAALGIHPTERAAVLTAVHETIDQAGGYGSRTTAISGAKAVGLVSLEGLAVAQGYLPLAPSTPRVAVFPLARPGA